MHAPHEEGAALSTLYVGDVHGCADELGELLQTAQASRVVLVGDLFTKGPDPQGVWDLIDAHACEAVLGNHDVYVLENWELASSQRAWLEALPLFLEEGSRVVVHAGLHPHRGVAGTSREMALTMRRFPEPDGPHWHTLWQGPTCVIFGHDAVVGCVDKRVDGRPVAIGLDSGCVYGGALTGWLAEEDRFLSVPAKRAYRSI